MMRMGEQRLACPSLMYKMPGYTVGFWMLWGGVGSRLSRRGDEAVYVSL